MATRVTVFLLQVAFISFLSSATMTRAFLVRRSIRCIAQLRQKLNSDFLRSSYSRYQLPRCERNGVPFSLISRSHTSSRNLQPFRLFSSPSAENASREQHIQEQSDLINPTDLVNSTIPFPTSLSPSAAAEFLACPQSYLFQYLLGVKQPTNEALAKGSMCHATLEKIFDLTPPERTLDVLKNLLRSSWAEVRDKDPYKNLFVLAPSKDKVIIPSTKITEGETNVTEAPERDRDAERKWGMEALQLLENYYEMEDPRKVLPPNPLRREMWVRANLTVDPTRGVTFHGMSHDDNTTRDEDDEKQHFLVRGIVDRLDFMRCSDGQVALRITDYKTAKSPNFKYSKTVNEKIADQNFWQLKIYALLIREMVTNDKLNLPNCDLRFLRLMYLTSDSGNAQYIDMDLGETTEERDAVLQNVHTDLSDVWVQIINLIKLQDATAFHHCERAFCFCHKARPRFKRGTVWERNRSNLSYF